MRIKFLHTRIVEDYRKGTKDEERYDKGKTYDLPEASALRWINRNVAVPVTVKTDGAGDDSAAEPADANDQIVDEADAGKPAKKKAKA